jgi:hypothetical protein
VFPNAVHSSTFVWIICQLATSGFRSLQGCFLCLIYSTVLSLDFYLSLPLGLHHRTLENKHPRTDHMGVTPQFLLVY